MKTVIVTGSRRWQRKQDVFVHLDVLDPEVVVQGGADGADKYAIDWCRDNGKICVTVFARWKELGGVAGPARNSQMLDLYPDATVLAFPMPDGSGTQDCMARATGRGMDLIVISLDGRRY